jgi:hypothetical protein
MHCDPVYRPAPSSPRSRPSGSRLIAAALALAACLPLHAADDPGTTTRGFIKCLELSDPAERLACYDRMAVAAVELGLTLPGAGSTAPAVAVVASPAATSPAPGAATAVDDFGLEQEKAQQALQSVTANVVGGFQGWSGETVFELDNGQVWEQAGSGRYEYSGEDRAVVIERGFLGSFSLKPEGLNRTVRVKRIK